MKTNITEYFIELIPDEGMELYNSELDIISDRITAPIGTDVSSWIEREVSDEDGIDSEE